MATQSHVELNVKISLFSLVLVTSIICPKMVDPIILPKFFFLVVTASLLIALVSTNLPSIKKWNNFEKQAIMACLLFILTLFITVLASPANLASQVYGEFARNNGFLTYISLLIYFVAGLTLFKGNSQRLIMQVLVFTGLVNGIYGMIQLGNLDPVSWSISTNKIIGTFGNSNFMSAFLSFSCLAALALTFRKQEKLVVKLFYGGTFLFLLLVAFKTQSIQGPFLVVIGSLIIVYKKFFSVQRAWNRLLFFLSISIIVTLSLLAIFQISPLKQMLYQESLNYRVDYWKAGLRIWLSNPLLGYGLDTYGSYYREFRDFDAADRRGLDQVSNSAHNYFLEILTNGGILLLMSSLVMFLVTAKSVFRLLNDEKHYDEVAVGLVVVWTAFILQSLISVNNLAISIWGWLISGAIVCRAGENSSLLKSNKAIEMNYKLRREGLKINKAVMLLTTILGFVAAILPVIQDQEFKRALQSGNATQLVNSTVIFPANQRYGEIAAQILFENTFFYESQSVAQSVLDRNPRSYDALAILYKNPTVNEEKKRIIKKRILEIEPSGFKD
jgi:O-antigen ligase